MYALKCIGYDDEFQRDIAAKDPEGWDHAYKANKAAGEPASNAIKGKVAQGKGERKGKGTGKGRVKGKGRSKGTGRAKAEDVMEEEDNGEGMTFIPQETKSRPRRSQPSGS